MDSRHYAPSVSSHNTGLNRDPMLSLGDSMGGAGGAGGLDEELRGMLDWLKKTVRLKGFAADKWTDEHDATALQFLTSSDCRRLVKRQSRATTARIVRRRESLLPVALCRFVNLLLSQRVRRFPLLQRVLPIPSLIS